MPDKKRYLVLMRRAPYGSSLARASVDLALAMGAFEQDFDLLFTGDGVLQLIPDQASENIGQKNIGRALSSLPLVDIEEVYVESAALARHGLTAADLVLPAIALDDTAVKALLNDCDHLVSC
ncbi:sulfurtransferase complex subunit TusC [Halioglobus maricola]|uniref:Sulfurtransferase complex subunit TusC n=1 Tax=Halioglobus maricola TaxID=2601894 RepID=A0A5P9NK11_9GAMM|nr:sulfurtransferase complex subunit TusC [Halioglobus maricola]QFU76107.1 sulfurtransferase complex subunit TusC [Halioglobus maricola]